MSLAEQMDTVTDASAGTVDRHATTQTFESTDPATGAVVGVFPVHDSDAVRETGERRLCPGPERPPPRGGGGPPPPRRRAVGRAGLRRPARATGRLPRLPGA